MATSFVSAFDAAWEDVLMARGVAVELDDAGGGRVEIVGLRAAPPRRRGAARWAVGVLCAAADNVGVELVVVPEPVTLLVDTPITRAALERFYADFGFRPQGRVWVRKRNREG